ncbi:TIGR03757 family integrating conjugative element protein [Acerihabitans arboris]|uniref:TIGR03757 family integrating conjugative element protein n=1 Tax=Acerihabitans arboris TaxID=2691583 RepID=A0A845SMS3_9GAMM|nr:TIGR03757 family integrating conjugative element protein [Acerihabitans arboris]NDL64256.1 TIGR03757 family integrating conjugative element protein [Acerihabitans arboris]
MLRLISFLPALFLSAGVCASTVIYTDGTHLISTSPSDISIVYLDAPDRLQVELFSPLPSDAEQAEMQARETLASPTFKAREQQLAVAYQGVMKAWSLGLKKYPAVVFDDKWVVYGTTDVDVATQQMNAWREVNQ